MSSLPNQQDIWAGEQKAAEERAKVVEPLPSSVTTPPSSIVIRAVRADCGEDGGSCYNTLAPSNHPIFEFKDLIPIPSQLGIPLVIYRIGTKTWMSGFARKNVLHNYYAETLHMDPTSKEAPKSWQRDGETGSCIIVRQDQKPLRAQHVKSLVRFIEWVNNPNGEQSSRYKYHKYGQPGYQKEDVDKRKAEFTKPAFEEFWKLYKDCEVDSPYWHDEKNLPGPYD